MREYEPEHCEELFRDWNYNSDLMIVGVGGIEHVVRRVGTLLCRGFVLAALEFAVSTSCFSKAPSTSIALADASFSPKIPTGALLSSSLLCVALLPRRSTLSAAKLS